MRTAAGVLVLCSLGLAITACQSAARGSSAGDVAHAAADAARRTGSSGGVPPCDDATTLSTCRALLAKPVTEESAVKVALLANASVRESYERLGIARADLLQAGLIANPVFSASAKFFSAGPEVELGLAQSFVEIFLVPLRRCVASADLGATQAEVVRDLVQLVYEVRRGLVALRGAEEVVGIRREALGTVVSARDLMKQLHEAGNVRATDLTVEEVGVARAQMDLDAALLEAREARASLSVLLGGCSTQVAWTVDGALPPIPPDAAAGGAGARALAASLDLLENKARIQSALASAGLARSSGLLPALDLGVVGKRESGGPWGFGPEVSTAIPIFDTGVARVLAASAVARQRVARHQHLTVEIEVAADRLAERVRVLRAREAYLEGTYLPLRRRLLDETMQTFNAMQIGAFDVLVAKEGEADARREHAETRTATWLAILDLSELLAGSLNRARIEGLHLPERAEPPTPPKGS